MAIGYPRILGLNNIAHTWGITASTEATAAGFPVKHLQSWRDDYQWRGTGAAEQWALLTVPLIAPGDAWDDLSAWVEVDPNNTLATVGNQLQHSFGGPGLNDTPNITATPVPDVAPDFAMELPFNISSWAVAGGNQQIAWRLDFDGGNHIVRFIMSNNAGAVIVNASYWEGAGWIGMGAYTLVAAGINGRIRFRRDADGTIYGWVYDPGTASYNLLGSHAGGAVWNFTDIQNHKIQYSLTNWAAGVFSSEMDTLYYATNEGINSLGISAHDFGTQGAGVRLDASVGGVGWDTPVPLVTPGNDYTFAEFFSTFPWGQYRLVIPVGYVAPPTIGILTLAPYLEIPSWPDSPHDPDEIEDIGASMISSTGHYLGSVIEGSMRVIEMRFPYLTHAFIHDTWIPFLRAHSRKPFIFLWDPVNNPKEAYFVWINDRKRAQPYSEVWRSFSLKLRGVYEP